MFGLFKKKIKSITHKGKSYSIDDINKLKGIREEENYETPVYEEVDKYAIKSIELTDEQLNNLKEHQLRKKANAWKSRQRKLRKEGKLEQFKIDKLNELGMIWNPSNPSEALWERGYLYFKNHSLADPIEDWVEEQRTLFRENRISDENLIRLQSVNFPFIKTKDENFKLSLIQIYEMEEQLNLGYKTYDDNHAKELFLHIQDDESEVVEVKDINYTKSQKKKLKELTQMSFNDFQMEIDKLFSRQYIKERIQGFIKSKQQHYGDVYFESFKYLKGVFETGKKIDYLNETVKFKCSDEVIVYASEKALNHLDKFMLSSGEYNDVKQFPPINKLIAFYSKNKKVDDLLRVNGIIIKYPILKAIYGDRINKVMAKFTKQ